MTQQETDQWRGSKLVGLDVYGSDNEKIGDINDVLVDRQGNLEAIVIGVGGFLGIGEKSVAIPFKSVEFVDTPRASTRTSDATSRSTDTSARTDATGSTTAAPATDRPATTATTGTTAGSGTAGTSAATSSSDRTGASSASRSAERGYPDHAMVRMSRADLQNAPAFRYAGERRSDDTRRSDTGGSSTAPRQ
ncbi:MAG TPA: PRC-barrel domain-containing protein [Beijerinckiaceae bacterium]|jgi:sporulation protein YlmC with PRC-barrel domain